MHKQVVKRDGSLEHYEPVKIARVLVAAGLTEEEAEKLAAEITVWVESLDEEEVASIDIRNEVIALLEAYPTAHGLFVWYEKAKDNQETNAS